MRLSTKNVGAATAGTLMGNALSLALPFFISAWFHSRQSTDAFFYALGAILFLNVVLSVAVEAATTPYLVTLLARDPKIAPKELRKIQLQAAVFCAAAVTVGIAITAAAILPTTSFTALQRSQVIDTLLALSPLPILITWNSVSAGACYAVNVFGLPTASVALRTVTAVACGFAFRESVGLMAIPLGLITGELVRLAVMELLVRRSLPRTRDVAVDIDGKHKPFWRSAGPQVASMSLGGLSPMIDKTVAISVGAGAVTTLELSQRLVYTPVLLLLSGVGLVLGSRWAVNLASKNWQMVASEYRRIIKIMVMLGVSVVLVTVPCAFALRPIIKSTLSMPDPSLLAFTFSAAAVGIPFALGSQVSVRVLLAARETKAMPYLTVLAVVVNLGLDVALVEPFGLPGIALASSAVNIVNFVSYGLIVRRLMAQNGVDLKPAARDVKPRMARSKEGWL